MGELSGIGNIADLSITQSNDFAMSEIVARDAAAMVAPKLNDLRALVSPTLSAWGEVLETSRELTPVLTDAVTGALLDRGVYAEDGAGGYWTLASGTDVLDAGGQPIARATLEDVSGLIWPKPASTF